MCLWALYSDKNSVDGSGTEKSKIAGDRWLTGRWVAKLEMDGLLEIQYVAKRGDGAAKMEMGG